MTVVYVIRLSRITSKINDDWLMIIEQIRKMGRDYLALCAELSSVQGLHQIDQAILEGEKRKGSGYA